MLRGCLLRTATVGRCVRPVRREGAYVFHLESSRGAGGPQDVRAVGQRLLGGRTQGVFGTIPPLPPACAAGLGEMFSTRSPGSPSASHSVPPSERTIG